MKSDWNQEGHWCTPVIKYANLCPNLILTNSCRAELSHQIALLRSPWRFVWSRCLLWTSIRICLHQKSLVWLGASIIMLADAWRWVCGWILLLILLIVCLLLFVYCCFYCLVLRKCTVSVNIIFFLQIMINNNHILFLQIMRVAPCSNVGTNLQCEMDPVSQAKASSDLAQHGLEVVGWYHSHPTFAPTPSLRDIDTQSTFQVILSSFRGNFNSNIAYNNKGRFCNNSEIDTLISKRLSVENKAKLSQLEIVNKQYCGRGVLSLNKIRCQRSTYIFKMSHHLSE